MKYIKQYPTWYWVKGLHDSKILSAKLFLLDYDYTEKSPIRNYISFQIDSRQAMFETDIGEIRFYNAKINIDKDLLMNSYWESDSLTFDKKYKLRLIVAKANAKINCEIDFDDAEVMYRK